MTIFDGIATFSNVVTIVSMVVTIGATIITIVQTRKAKRASADASAAVAKVRLAANADRLRSAQVHIRSLPSTKNALRGSKPKGLIMSIRQEFDVTLGVLPTVGPGSRARELLVFAQTGLNQYERALPDDVDRDAWQIVQTNVQDAISDLAAIATLPGDTK